MNGGRRALLKGVFAASVGVMSLMNLVCPVAGQAETVQQIELKNMRAEVHVWPENRRDLGVSVTYPTGGKLPKLIIRTLGNRMSLDGQQKIAMHDAEEAQSVPADKLTQSMSKPHLILNLHTPKDVALSAREGIFEGEIGPSHSLVLNMGGEGRWHFQDVTTQAQISLGGEGEIEGAQVGTAHLDIGGPGHIRLKSSGALDGAIGGHGQIRIESPKGIAKLVIAGAGQVLLEHAALARLSLSIMGSGNARIGGVVRDADVSVMGSGRVHVDKVTGHYKARTLGPGWIQRGDKNILP